MAAPTRHPPFPCPLGREHQARWQLKSVIYSRSRLARFQDEVMTLADEQVPLRISARST